MKRQDYSIIFANVLDNYDAYLYGFMAPLMAPLFFPKHEFLVQLILAYSLLATSSITRPLGSLIFGWLACHKDPWQILRFTLMGVGITTLMMGCLPTYAYAGYWAAIGLFIVRMLNGIFAAGEKTLASLYLIEGKASKTALTTNAWYESSVMWGITGASWAASLVSQQTWRIPFLLGGGLVLYTLFLRYCHSHEKGNPENLAAPLGSRFRGNDTTPSIRTILTIILSMGLSYITYDIPFVFMNSFVPLITNVSYQSMMHWNTLLLIADMLLILGISYIIRDHTPRNIKKIATLMLAIPAIPLFHFMEGASFGYVLLVRSWVVFWGVIFACVLNVRLLQLCPHANKYLLIGFWGSAGATLIGRSTSALCLWGWHKTHMAAIPGIYLCLIASLVLLTSLPKYDNLS